MSKRTTFCLLVAMTGVMLFSVFGLLLTFFPGQFGNVPGGRWLMTGEERRVAQLITEAFDGVVLGDGVGLRQGCGLDEYADDQTLARYRALDEKLDWQAIPVEDLKRHSTSLSYFDAEGMRFHLPAYMLAELRGEMATNLDFHLSYNEDGDMERFALLNAEQRFAVAEFLKLQLPAPDFIEPQIKAALNDFWEVQ